MTFARETHPSSNSSFLCRGFQRVGTHTATPQFPLSHTPDPQTPKPPLQHLNPMAPKMLLLPEEHVAGSVSSDFLWRHWHSSTVLTPCPASGPLLSHSLSIPGQDYSESLNHFQNAAPWVSRPLGKTALWIFCQGHF